MPNPKANTFAGFHTFRNHDDEAGAYGSFEVFYDPAPHLGDPPRHATDDAGWYWWACFPGCLPDGEACGPHDTSEAAYREAQGE